MLFNSIQFLIFFPLVTLAYFLLPGRLRWALLLGASCYFYMAFVPYYILILAVTIIIDYFAGAWIEDSTGRKRKFLLLISIISTCLVLFIFKYYNFAANNINALAEFLHWNYSIEALTILLPIGLSFHTFQSLSYVIEVYRGRQTAERHFGIYSLYVMFYPQLVAGPIERPQNLLHQFHDTHRFDYEKVRSGLLLMLWGFFKKAVVADRVALYVNAVYGNVEQHNGLTLIVATIFFAFQIYADFSGYSDIARGSARVMGFDLMLNFNRPYFSENISEFWRRWHISLSTWFQDYVYIPLGGNRVARPRWFANLMITFLISGLWHGANWTYIAWGALNGIYLVAGNLLSPALPKSIPGPIKVLTTFALTCIAWVFFRSENMSDALLALHKMTSDYGPLFTAGTRDFIHGIVAITMLLGLDYVSRGQRFEDFVIARSLASRWTFYLALLIAIATMGVYGATQFIYFQF